VEWDVNNKEEGTMNLSTAAVIVAGFVTFGMLPGTSQAAMSDDEAKIRTLEDSFVAAVNAKDVDAIMKVYVPDASLVVFDVVPPRQYLGADAYRKDWQDFFALFKGPVKFRISDLNIEAAGTLGYSHSIQYVSGTDMKDQPIELVVRVTDGYRKVDGNWLIAHEHVSVPVDVTTGKPDLMSKP
jgi:ketosteroid isomerase-like protein